MAHKHIRLIFLIVLFVFITIWIIVYPKRQQLAKQEDKPTYGFGQGRDVSWWDQSSSYIANLNLALKEEDKTIDHKRKLILNFCDTILGNAKLSAWFAKDWLEYEPKKSLFMYSLCMSVEPKYEFDQDLLDNLKVDAGFIKSKYFQEACDPDLKEENQFMNWCKLSQVTHNLFHQIMSDWTDIFTASIYGYLDKDLDKAVEMFSEYYFPKHGCGDDYYYLYKETLIRTSPEKETCNHPQTNQYLREYILNTKELLKQVEIPDPQKVLEEAKCTEDKSYNIIRCAFHPMEPIKDNLVMDQYKVFKNLLLNEYMYYRLFLSYYSFIIQNDPNIVREMKPVDMIWESESRAQYEVQATNYELYLAQESMQQVFRMTSNLKINFPAHIGMMAYYEDMINFSKKFRQMYTPLDQLYWKFRYFNDLRR